MLVTFWALKYFPNTSLKIEWSNLQWSPSRLACQVPLSADYPTQWLLILLPFYSVWPHLGVKGILGGRDWFNMIFNWRKIPALNEGVNKRLNIQHRVRPDFVFSLSIFSCEAAALHSIIWLTLGYTKGISKVYLSQYISGISQVYVRHFSSLL